MMRTITVAELRDLLDGEDDEALVIFSTSYGDYGRTQQALPIDGEIERRRIEESAYSNSGYALVSRGEWDEDPPEVECGNCGAEVERDELTTGASGSKLCPACGSPEVASIDGPIYLVIR